MGLHIPAFDNRKIKQFMWYRDGKQQIAQTSEYHKEGERGENREEDG
jgi:hypothetical protein